MLSVKDEDITIQHISQSPTGRWDYSTLFLTLCSEVKVYVTDCSTFLHAILWWFILTRCVLINKQYAVMSLQIVSFLTRSLLSALLEGGILISKESSYLSHYPCNIWGKRYVAFRRYKRIILKCCYRTNTCNSMGKSLLLFAIGF